MGWGFVEGTRLRGGGVHLSNPRIPGYKPLAHENSEHARKTVTLVEALNTAAMFAGTVALSCDRFSIQMSIFTASPTSIGLQVALCVQMLTCASSDAVHVLGDPMGAPRTLADCKLLCAGEPPRGSSFADGSQAAGESSTASSIAQSTALRRVEASTTIGPG